MEQLARRNRCEGCDGSQPGEVCAQDPRVSTTPDEREGQEYPRWRNGKPEPECALEQQWCAESMCEQEVRSPHETGQGSLNLRGGGIAGEANRLPHNDPRPILSEREREHANHRQP